MKKIVLACAVAVVALAAQQQAYSKDSVRSGPPADVPWQAPNARALNGKAESQLNVNSANTANTANTANSAASATFATNAGALGGGDLNWVRNNAVYAHSAGAASTATTATTATTANTANTAITATNADNATNATNAANAAYASSAGNGVSGVSGSTLTLANGSTVTLPSGGTTDLCSTTVSLQGGSHNGAQCCLAGGTPTSIGGGAYICKFSGSSCPAGWSAYQNWTTTQGTSGYYCTLWSNLCGPDLTYGCCGTAFCSTSGHSFSNASVETTVGCTSSVTERGCL